LKVRRLWVFWFYEEEALRLILTPSCEITFNHVDAGKTFRKVPLVGLGARPCAAFKKR
jgi:hypothetical protein